MKKEHGKNNKLIFVITILLIIIAYIIMMFTDYIKVSNNKKPLICFKVRELNDGGTKEYFCLGYKIIKYNVIDGRDDTCIAPLFMKYTSFSENKRDKSDMQITDEKVEYTDIRGYVSEIFLSDSGNKTIFVEGDLEKDTLFDKAYVSIKKDTKIYKEGVLVDVDEIQKGQRVDIKFAGDVQEVYPVKAVAKEIVIIK